MSIAGPRDIGTLLLLSNLAFFCGQASAAEQKPAERAGNLRFTLPSGWQRTNRGDAAILTPSDLPNDRRALVIILPARQHTGTLRAWFDATWKELTDDYTLVSGGEPSARDGNEKNIEIIYAAGLFEDKGGKEICILLFGANGGDHVESFIFLADSHEMYQRYGKAVQAFMSSLRFENVRVEEPQARKPAEAAQSITNEKLQGLWVGPARAIWYNSTPILNPYGAANTTAFLSNYLYFFPDGRVISKVPRDGLSRFDFKSFQKEHPQECGTYTLSAGEARIIWPKRTVAAKLKADGKLSCDSATFSRLPACDGLKLQGTYASCLVSDKGVADSFISFSRAGKFREMNFLNNSAGKGGSGSYRILRNTLELTYDNGTVRRELFWVNQSDIPKETIDSIVVADKVLDLRT